jgi:ATP-dependent Lhr-like helicase
VTSDSFAGIRALITSKKRRARLRQYRRPFLRLEDAGRWSLPRRSTAAATAEVLSNPATDHIARVLLRRYGVVFRKLIERESGPPPWRELFYVYRRMEARGEVRGGRFVSTFAGEQFALSEAADLLRKVYCDAEADRTSFSAADPLNLVGNMTGGDRVSSLSRTRILFENGIPVAVHAGRKVRFLTDLPISTQSEVRRLLVQHAVPVRAQSSSAPPH